MIRYGMVSVIATIVAFTVLVLLFGLLHLWGEIVSTVVANVVATFPAYFLNRRWVWGKTGRSHMMKEIVPFWGMQALGILVSIGGAVLARHIGVENNFSHREQTGLVVLANLLSFGVFYVLKYLVFNRLFQVHTLEDLDERVELLVPVVPIPVPELPVHLWADTWIPWLAAFPVTPRTSARPQSLVPGWSALYEPGEDRTSEVA